MKYHSRSATSLRARYTSPIDLVTLAMKAAESHPPAMAPQNSGGRWQATPSVRELIVLWALTSVLFVGFVSIVRNYAVVVDDFGDSSAYMALASAIRHWDFSGVVIKQFWGLPYAMAALSSLTRLSDRTSLLAISMISSFAATLLVGRLWGGWIAGFFAILNFDWMQRSYLGGSEPLFVALLFGCFLAVRKERWALAALLASLSTVVRPLGVFALLGIGIVLLLRRDYRSLIAAIIIGAVVGGLYAWPLASHFGDPLATVHSYHKTEWQGGWLFGFPFYAIIKGTLTEPAPVTNLVLSFGWILLVLIAIVLMIKAPSFRQYAREHLVETIFLIPYLWTLFTYNYPHWARGNFARFSIPILPFVLLSLYRWIPKDRRVLWALALLMPLLAAASAIGIRNLY